MADKNVLVVGARDVENALLGREEAVLDAVRRAYETHARGDSSLPHSSFLRFPDSDKDRIICLPAYLGDDYQLAGVKWIASMPDNLAKGMESSDALVETIDRGRELHKKPTDWKTIQQRCMSEDFSWAESGREYMKAYRKVVKKNKASGK